MKVTHMCFSLSRSAGGLFVSVRRLSQELVLQGCEVAVLGLEDNYSVADASFWTPITPQWIMRQFPKVIGYAPGLIKLLDETSPHVVHSHGIWQYNSLVAMKWAAQNSRPRVVSTRGMLEPWARSYRVWKKLPIWWLWERANLSSAQVLHATSQKEAFNLRQLGVTAPIAVIPNGVDIPKMVQKTSNGSEATALFLSRIHPKKGLLNLVDAWNKARPTGWRVLIAGPDDGGHEIQVKTAVHDAGLEGMFSFLGQISESEKWNIYQQADLFILPSHSENFGLVIAEALAAGVPVITTQETPWKELKDFNCGWWIGVGVEPLVEALRVATALSRSDLHEMGLRGRKLVAEKYTWSNAAAEMKEVYEWIIHGGAAPRCLMLD
jgi:glycosyltransferase involved in cell wall biosynthesis